jgi:hypothetical protein
MFARFGGSLAVTDCPFLRGAALPQLALLWHSICDDMAKIA